MPRGAAGVHFYQSKIVSVLCRTLGQKLNGGPSTALTDIELLDIALLRSSLISFLLSSTSLCISHLPRLLLYLLLLSARLLARRTPCTSTTGVQLAGSKPIVSLSTQPKLIQGGKILSNGTDYTSEGPLVSAIAYLQTVCDCGFNGELCTIVKTTLQNGGSGSVTGISLISPHKFSVTSGFGYYHGCDGAGADCSSARHSMLRCPARQTMSIWPIRSATKFRLGTIHIKSRNL